MGSRLMNVRLDEVRIRKARALRARGVSVSGLVREAIDARFEDLGRALPPQDVAALLERVFERYPDPVGLPPRGYDVHDRRAARAAIRRKLRSR